MKRTARRNRAIAEINVVPYIDVMLVLLVIFMITTPLLTQGVKIDLPKASAKALPSTPAQPIIVSVDAKGRYYLNVAAKPQQPMRAQVIATRVAAYVQLAKREGQVRNVLVKGDKHVDYGKVVRAMVLMQRAGVKHVGLMTQSPTETS